MLIQNASWITMEGAASTVVPVFRKRFACGKAVRSAVLEVTCDGVYEAVLNGRRGSAGRTRRGPERKTRTSSCPRC